MAPAPRTCRAAHLFSIKAVTWMGLLGLHDQKPRGTARRVSSFDGTSKNARAHPDYGSTRVSPHRTRHTVPLWSSVLYSILCRMFTYYIYLYNVKNRKRVLSRSTSGIVYYTYH